MKIPSCALGGEKKISFLKTELGGDSNVHLSQDHSYDSTGLRLNWKSESLVILKGKESQTGPQDPKRLTGRGASGFKKLSCPHPLSTSPGVCHLPQTSAPAPRAELTSSPKRAIWEAANQT